MSKLADAIVALVGRPDLADAIERLVLSDRNRRAKARGHAYERKVAREDGGRRTGPLLGRDDVLVDGRFAIQTKKEERPPSLNVARTYLAELHERFPNMVPLFVHSFPGKNKTAVVVLYRTDWRTLYGGNILDSDRTDV